MPSYPTVWRRSALSKQTSGYTHFPLNTVTNKIRQTCNNPKIRQEAEEYMLSTLACKGSAGMDPDRLFRRAVNYLTKKNAGLAWKMFTIILQDGPFEHEGSHVIYAAQYDTDHQRSVTLSALFAQADAESSQHAVSNNAVNHEPIDNDRATVNEKGPEYDGSPATKVAHVMDAWVDGLYDAIAFTAAGTVGHPYPLERLLGDHEMHEYTEAQIKDAVAQGPFKILSEHVLYDFALDQQSKTRRDQYLLLVSATAQELVSTGV